MHAFVDRGFDPKEFLLFFLQSYDFKVETLRRLAGKSGKKSKLASRIPFLMDEGRLSPVEVIRELARQPRGWLALKQGTPENERIQEDPVQLLWDLGEPAWHGPIEDLSHECNWYLRPLVIPYSEMVGGSPRTRKIRWLVVAKVTQEYIALKWDGFTYAEDPNRGASQFQFWYHVPEFIAELELAIGGTWSEPSLSRLVLKDLWAKYMDAPSYEWEHLRLRAMAQGVALNARSSGVKEIDVRGLTALTGALAEAAVGALDLGSLEPAQMKRVESALLRKLIHEWGTNSYEFRLMGKESGRTVFRGHCYFGLSKGQRGQDAFQHINCFHESGASNGALEFILGHL